jgi:hypothetical protein
MKHTIITTPAGEELVLLAKADFDALVEAAEDLTDVAAFDAAVAEGEDLLSAEDSTRALERARARRPE